MTRPPSADQIPVTLLVTLAYVTLAFLTGGLGAGADSEKLMKFGTLMPLLVADGEWWRLFASTFLHGGLVHLAFNTMMLLSVGPAIERSLGSVRFAILYLTAGLGGSLAVCSWYEPVGSVVGGSGALFGLLGAVVAINMRSGRHLLSFLDFEGPRRLLGMIVANLVIGFVLPFVSNTAHIGGLIAGFLVTFLWLVPPRAPTKSFEHWRLATLALFVSLTFASTMPVTRWDWLAHRAIDARDDAQGDTLLRAAAMSLLRQDDATARDARQLRDELRDLNERLGRQRRR